MKNGRVFILLLTLIIGCGGSSAGSGQFMCRRDPNTNLDQCYTNDYRGAAIGAGTATAVWGITGCTVNGCQPPDVCNPQTKMCERPPCEGNSGCPFGFHCDLKDKRCK